MVGNPVQATVVNASELKLKQFELAGEHAAAALPLHVCATAIPAKHDIATKRYDDIKAMKSSDHELFTKGKSHAAFL